MTRRSRHRPGSGPGVELRQRESVAPLELFFDLVFVLSFTQCTALMAAQASWTAVGHGMLVLAMVWWAWVLFAWLTSLVEPEEGPARIVMLATMAAVLLLSLSVPQAFGDRALLFAIAYGIVRLGHIALFRMARRANPTIRRSIVSVAISSIIAISLLVAASFTSGVTQAALWAVAILVEWAGPAVFVDTAWRLVPAHFAERHSLIIIIALGESIVAIGAGADVGLSASVIVAAMLGIALAAALWWIYFDVVALVTARRLMQTAEGRQRIALARDSYSYLHFPMVAGIVLVAFGLKATLSHVDQPLDALHATALLGGTALYLLAHVALRLRNAHTINVERLVAALVLLASIAAALHVDALLAVGAVVALLWAMIGYETFFVYDERRYRLRHGLDVTIPGSHEAAEGGDLPTSGADVPTHDG